MSDENINPPGDENIAEDQDLTDAVLGEHGLEEELKKVTAERDEYLLLAQKVKSDFANWQKRAQKERDTDRLYAPTAIVTDLLEVVDNLDRAIAAGSTTDESSSGMIDGVKMVHQQFLDTLTRHGVTPIEALGLAFDPNVHEALMQEETDQVEPGTVTMELQKGFKLHDRVLRPSKVKVAKAPSGG